MSQKDIQTDLTKPDPIGMGSYNSDSHNVQRVINRDGFVRNEGDMQVAVEPYQIPYRVLLPKKNEAENLLVPVCFSATHVAYSTLRMEPQYMILGQAAGVAAAMAIRGEPRRAGYRHRGADPDAGGTGRHSGIRAGAAEPVDCEVSDQALTSPFLSRRAGSIIHAYEIAPGGVACRLPKLSA